ncbi:MAG: zinc-dependent metalloprotease, partial [Chloroflexota bacterium]|nr:zinc-dependent metalloprotease [Chloroflexota bacterium]
MRQRASPRGWRPDRAWQIGFAVGAAAAVAASVLRKRADHVARQGLVDWNRAEAVAVGRLRRAPGSLDAIELTASEEAYARAMERIVPLLEDWLARPLPGVVERHAVVDRAGWARANLVTFKHLVGRLEESLLDRMVPSNGTLGHSLAAIANRFVTTQQIGFLLGYLGTRVLGQYDV